LVVVVVVVVVVVSWKTIHAKRKGTLLAIAWLFARKWLIM
jgi:hypothetical protein